MAQPLAPVVAPTPTPGPSVAEIEQQRAAVSNSLDAQKKIREEAEAAEKAEKEIKELEGKK